MVLRMRMLPKVVISALLFTAGAATAATAADVPNLDLKFGVLSGLSGDLAQGGQPWLDSARIGIENMKSQIDAMGYGDKIHITFVGGEDSQGTAQGGIEAAKKLVSVNGANVVIGDFFSSVTVAAAQSVFIPQHIIDFTGGTAASIADLNKKVGTTWLWRLAPPDSIQGKVVGQLIEQEIGKGKTINVGGRNDTYGVGLIQSFKDVWTKGGGKIGATVIYDPASPTLDTEAQQLVASHPDGWFIVAFCGDWGKLKGPLQRTGAWDPAKTFGGDALGGCPKPNETLAGMRNTRGNVMGGESSADWAKLFASKSKVPYSGSSIEAFDAPYITLLAALKAGSSDPDAIRQQLVAVTNGTGPKCTFKNFDVCVKTVLAGQTPQFEGATGPIAFNNLGDPSIVTYNILLSKGDGAIHDPIVGTLKIRQ